MGAVALVKQTDSWVINDTNTLHTDLLRGYNKNIRGNFDQSTSTILYVRFFISSVNSFDVMTGTLAIVGYFDIIWVDERMTWESSAYNGTTHIVFNQDDVWTPVVILGNGNGEDGLETLGNSYLQVRYFPNGQSNWNPGDKYETFCGANIKDYPYDAQWCEVQFIPWGYSANEIQFSLIESECNQNLYSANGQWELQECYLDTLYVAESTQLLRLNLQLKRRASFYFVSLILPIGALGVLNLLVFLLPPESGERIGYSITLLLAICVFLTIASDNLPQSSYPSFSFLCTKLLIDMMISSLVVLFTIIGLRFYFKNDEHKVPDCVAAVASCILCRCCRSGRREKSVYEREVVIQTNGNPYFMDGKLPRLEVNETKGGKETGYKAPRKRITWTDVGIASDIVFFVFTLLAFIISHVTYFIYVNVVEIDKPT
ncbi:hypothetical protein FSP39_025244 [Pinctada imbricata]|uniref:Uncharacterized protein n=1 Tax=Pinctada imbricata TaxID=66713 RepID=A0AA88Y1M4_PINIB|nr:hypothetical protein FSP39_025244 [Pinctada imbricata]